MFGTRGLSLATLTDGDGRPCLKRPVRDAAVQTKEKKEGHGVIERGGEEEEGEREGERRRE